MQPGRGNLLALVTGKGNPWLECEAKTAGRSAEGLAGKKPWVEERLVAIDSSDQSSVGF